MKKNNFNYYILILFTLMLVSYIFINKYIYLAPNLNINIGILIYPFTFLILIYMYNRFNNREVKTSIITCSVILLGLYLILSILNSLESITNSEYINESLRLVFTPHYFEINKLIIYYPDLISLFTYSLIFFITHYIFITVYEAIESNTNYLLAFILAILIGFILDQMLFIPLTNFRYLLDETLSYHEFIDMMTANFIIVIFSSVIMLGIYILTYKKKKN